MDAERQGAPTETVSAQAMVQLVLARLGISEYAGGVNGTCYECPFATEPLRRTGELAPWGEVSNDPTEAYFRCSLPGRDAEAVVWGEYAPCTEDEWRRVGLEAAAVLRREVTQLRHAIQHVIADSPGTPHSVKEYLRRAVVVPPEEAQEGGASAAPDGRAGA